MVTGGGGRKGWREGAHKHTQTYSDMGMVVRGGGGGGEEWSPRLTNEIEAREGAIVGCV